MNAPRPFTLVAELTHRCALHCAYCSNPVDLMSAGRELDTASWCRVIEEAETLGVVQLHLSGGEPLLRPDLEALVKRARALGLYTNLITGAVPLERERLAALAQAGLEHVQVSVQHPAATASDRLAGAASFERKLAAMRWAKDLGLRLTVNAVVTRANIDAVAGLVALAEREGADRIELASVQLHGFALANRAELLPEREQIEEAIRIARAARARLAGSVEVVFVRPDAFSPSSAFGLGRRRPSRQPSALQAAGWHGRFWERPRPCMDGWARRYVVIAPDGRVLPCHAATSIPGLVFESVRDRALAAIWSGSEALNRFRGEAWMSPTCRACPERADDFGGCRCQAYALTGNAAATDPACALSPDRALLERTRTPILPGDRGRAEAAARYLHRGRPPR